MSEIALAVLLGLLVVLVLVFAINFLSDTKKVLDMAHEADDKDSTPTPPNNPDM